MAKTTIVSTSTYVPSKIDFEKVDDMFTENYATIATIQAGTGFALTEYANNCAAVSGGLVVGDLYTTTGTVMVVTA
jgi:hypothetical protein